VLSVVRIKTRAVGGLSVYQVSKAKQNKIRGNESSRFRKIAAIVSWLVCGYVFFGDAPFSVPVYDENEHYDVEQ